MQDSGDTDATKIKRSIHSRTNKIHNGRSTADDKRAPSLVKSRKERRDLIKARKKSAIQQTLLQKTPNDCSNK